MDIRFARPAETEEIAALWAEAFPGKRTIADRARMLETGGRYGGLETVLVARDADGRLAGACKIYRMTQHLAGAPLPMMGLAAVAVAPYARRRGLGATLCGAAVEEARARGDVLSTLYPFRPDYYERLGWGLAGSLLRYRFRLEHLPEYDEARHVHPARLPEDAEPIAACYQRVASRSNGAIARDRRIWAYRLAGEELGVRPIDDEAVLTGAGPGKDRIVVCDRDGVSGYAILRPTPGRTREAALHVRELVAETEESYRALIGHLAAQRDQWPLGLHYARPEERFEERLTDPRPPRFTASRSLYFPTATVVRGPMLRVLDVPAAVRARPLFPGSESRGYQLVLAVQDSQVPANEGPWRVIPAAHDGDSNVVEPAKGGATSPEARLQTDAATFARILAGELRASDAERLGRARVEGSARLLDSAFHANESFWLPDEF
ncbi:MAG: GNAT family N-acetyltransferase [Gemmatimonadetes bacterium]|nr:GNAT family N-acetyltransferase [Gemmatimonadota bacterium]